VVCLAPAGFLTDRAWTALVQSGRRRCADRAQRNPHVAARTAPDRRLPLGDWSAWQLDAETSAARRSGGRSVHRAVRRPGLERPSATQAVAPSTAPRPIIAMPTRCCRSGHRRCLGGSYRKNRAGHRASAGLGAHFARLFARNGHDLVLVARRQDKLDQLATELSQGYGTRSTVIAADLTYPKGAVIDPRAAYLDRYRGGFPREQRCVQEERSLRRP
jgi:hypothetical protein